MYRFGLCCIHMGLQESGFKFQTMTWKRYSELGAETALPILLKRYENNLLVMKHILMECAKNNWCYRVSSDIFPLMTYKLADISYDLLANREKLDELFCDCSQIIKNNNIRISCHPDQFNVLASINSDAVDRTVIELNHHGWFMTKLGARLSHESPINIHVNANKGNTSDIAQRFAQNFVRLSDDVKARLVVENEDKGIWNTTTMLNDFHSRVKVPITFDYLHHACNNDGTSEEIAFKSCVSTWNHVKPLFHYSESFPDSSNRRKHADFPQSLPNIYGVQVDLDFEFKMKDAAIARGETLRDSADRISADFAKFDSNKPVDNVIT